MELLIGKILPLEILRPRVSEEQWLASATMSAKRQAERLSVRAMLNEYMGGDYTITYNKNGAPRIEGSNLYISISHSKEMVAIALDERPCCVDIESLERRYEAIKSRYTTPEEEALIGDRALAIIWAAKEAIYKLSDTPALELLSIKLLSIESTTRIITASTPTRELIKLSYSFEVENHILLWGEL